MKQLRQYLSGNMRQYGMVIALTVITLLFGILTDGNIFNAMNVSNLILQNSYLILLSVGMFFCILTGNVDLSVGSVLAFCGSILGVLIVKCGLNPWLSTILVLALGVTIGVIQGVFIAYLNVPPFIVTLAGELMFRGLTLVILAGHSISPFPADFQYIASGFVAEQLKAGPVNILAVICAVCAFAAIIWIQIADRRQRIGYGFAAEPIAFTIIKNVLIFIVAGFIFYKMATYRGIPLILLILLAFVDLQLHCHKNDHRTAGICVGRQSGSCGAVRHQHKTAYADRLCEQLVYGCRFQHYCYGSFECCINLCGHQL